MKPLSKEQIDVKQPGLNDDILSIIKSFVDYFETVDKEVIQKTREREA